MTVGVLIVLIIAGVLAASGLLGVGFYRHGDSGPLESFWYGFVSLMTAGAVLSFVILIVAAIVSTWTVPL